MNYDKVKFEKAASEVLELLVAEPDFSKFKGGIIKKVSSKELGVFTLQAELLRSQAELTDAERLAELELGKNLLEKVALKFRTNLRSSGLNFNYQISSHKVVDKNMGFSAHVRLNRKPSENTPNLSINLFVRKLFNSDDKEVLRLYVKVFA